MRRRKWGLFSPTCLILVLFLVAGVWCAEAAAARLSLDWNDMSDNELGFKIERRLSSGTFTQITTLGANTTLYVDIGLADGTTYCYQVRAYNAAGDSAPSNEACGTTPTPAPQSFTLSVSKSGSGSGTVNGPGISCGADCSETYSSGTVVTLTAVADTGSTFTGWSGGGCSGTDSCTILTNTDISVTAIFDLLPLPPPPDSSGLVAAYGFDEGSGSITVDSSNHGFDGTLVNSPTWTAGQHRSALWFAATDNGNDNDDPRVALGSTLNVPDPPFTISAWINPTDFSDYRAIFSKRDSYSPSTMRFDWGLSAGAGTVYFTQGSSVTNFTYAPPVNVWTHLTLVAEASGTKLYVNGNLQQTLGAITLGVADSANVVIGGTGEGSGGDNDPFKGLIDDFRLYNQALSQEEILSDMATPVGASLPLPSPQTFTLTVTKTGDGSGTVGGPGVDCGTDCTESFEENSQVTLAATADGTSTFAGWSGDCDVNGQVQMVADTTCTATFDLLPPPDPPSGFALAVNAGGQQYVAPDGTVYQADTWFQRGKTGTTQAAIAGTNEDPLYQSERTDRNFAYDIPVANGIYTVTLKFAEIGRRPRLGRRVFDVLIEGQEVVSNLDIFAKVGANAAYDVAIPVNVADGRLTIIFDNDNGKATVGAFKIVSE